MLKNAKPKLQSDIEEIVKKSVYEAFMAQFNGCDQGDINDFTKNEMEKSAKKVSEKASKLMGEPLATAIYEFVLEIGIMAIPGGLTSPHGPVTGSIVENEFKIS